MSSRQKLIDAATKHQVFMQRYGGGVFKEIQPFLESLKKETKRLLKEAPEIMSKNRQNALIAEITQLQTVTYNNIEKTLTRQMRELGKYELDFTRRMLKSSTEGANFELPTQKQVFDAAFSSIVDAAPGFRGSPGLTMSAALSQFGVEKAGEITRAARAGFALGTPTDEIANQIGRTIGRKFQRQAETLARTLTNHMANQSRKTFYDANDDILENYKIVATLDSRTSFTCMALDSKEFSPDEFEAPPYHYNCRTTYIRIPRPKYDIGADAEGKRSARNLETGKTTTVGSRTTYNSWLKDQDARFQDEILGRERAKLFREGVHVDKFVDQNYHPINLNQLRDADDQFI